MGLFRRGDLPEPPFAGAPQGLAPGYHVTRMPSRDAVDRFCRQWGVDPIDAYRKTKFVACVVPSLGAVVMPPEGALDPTRDAAVLDHESLHTHGYVHQPNGKGWKRRGLIGGQAQHGR